MPAELTAANACLESRGASEAIALSVSAWRYPGTAAGQQGRSVFEYLEAVVSAWFAGDAAPSLLPRAT